jgi:hypothetical protein
VIRIKFLGFSLTAVFNFLFGYLFQYIFVLYVILYLYIAEALGWNLDPTLEKGLLIPFLIATIVSSLIYVSTIMFTNKYLWKKSHLKKSYFLVIIIVIFSLGVLSNGDRIGLLFS